MSVSTQLDCFFPIVTTWLIQLSQLKVWINFIHANLCCHPLISSQSSKSPKFLPLFTLNFTSIKRSLPLFVQFQQLIYTVFVPALNSHWIKTIPTALNMAILLINPVKAFLVANHKEGYKILYGQFI